MPADLTPLPFRNRPARLLPDRGLPAYAYVPGHTPHPQTAADGHSAGVADPACEPLTHSNWRRHETWRWGIDLFNAAFWWEAHEQWEAAWKQPASDQTAHLLQGLIQLGAALIKWNLGNARGRAGLWRRSRQHLVAAGPASCHGVDAGGVIVLADDLFASHPVRGPTAAGRLTGPVVTLRA